MQIENKAFSKIVTKANDYSDSLSEIYIQGKSTGIYVRGEYLEQCIKISSSRYIVFLSNNCIYEESLRVSLIDTKSKKCLDHFSVFLMYNTDIFYGATLEENYIIFDFLNDKLWQLEVLNKPRFGSPISFNRHISKRFSFKNYLVLKTRERTKTRNKLI